MIKAVFVDIDGTLKNSQGEISIKVQNEIEKCIKNGIKIILTSGRARIDAINLQKKIGASPYIISSNGASIYDEINNKEIYSEPLDTNTVYKLLDYSEKNEYEIKLNYENKIVLNTAFYPDEKDKEISIGEMKKIIANEKIVQCVILNQNIDKMLKFKEYLNENLFNVKIGNESKKLQYPDAKPSKNYYCDIISKSVKKGLAVKKLCDYLNIKLDEVITIGDGVNDISMFEITPNSVAMGNAMQNVKNKAKYVTKTNDEDGVAIVLKNKDNL